MNDPHVTSLNTSPPIVGVPAAVREVWSEYYTDEEMAAMGDALIHEDVVEAARRLQAYHAQQPAADRAQPPQQHPLVAETEPERSSQPSPDQAEAADEAGWEIPVQRRGDAHPAQATLVEDSAESRDRTGGVTQHGGVDEFEGVPEARPQEVTVSVAQAARRLVAAGHDPTRPGSWSRTTCRTPPASSGSRPRDGVWTSTTWTPSRPAPTHPPHDTTETLRRRRVSGPDRTGTGRKGTWSTRWTGPATPSPNYPIPWMRVRTAPIAELGTANSAARVASSGWA
jgi:hypothetical protein